MTHPSYLGWQKDWPLFVKVPFAHYKQGDFFDWIERDVTEERVAALYANGQVYHNKELETQQKVGDRLNEMNGEQLYRLVSQLNAEVKRRTTSAKEFADKKCKSSKIDPKQRGLVRRWLRSNTWAEDLFYQYRDMILGE